MMLRLQTTPRDTVSESFVSDDRILDTSLQIALFDQQPKQGGDYMPNISFSLDEVPQDPPNQSSLSVDTYESPREIEQGAAHLVSEPIIREPTEGATVGVSKRKMQDTQILIENLVKEQQTQH